MELRSTTGGALFGIATTAAQNGVASFPILWIQTAGYYQLAATSGPLSSAVSQSFTIHAAAADHLSFSAQPGKVNAGQAMSTDVVVLVVDHFGNTVTDFSKPVVISLVQQSDDSVLGSVTVPVSRGMAVLSGLVISRSGTYFLRATCAGLGLADSSTFSVS